MADTTLQKVKREIKEKKKEIEHTTVAEFMARNSSLPEEAAYIRGLNDCLRIIRTHEKAKRK